MEQTLSDLLAREDDDDLEADLKRAEAALADYDDRDEDLDAALTALIWRRQVSGARGLVNCMISPDCLARLEQTSDDLDRVGAQEAAERYRTLRRACPLSERQLGPGLIDWLDTDFEFSRETERLNQDLPDIGPDILDFLRRRSSICANIPVPPEKRGLLIRLFG